MEGKNNLRMSCLTDNDTVSIHPAALQVTHKILYLFTLKIINIYIMVGSFPWKKSALSVSFSANVKNEEENRIKVESKS